MAGIRTAESNAERIAQVIFEYAAKISRQTMISALVPLNADMARDLVGAERCSLWLIDEKSGELWTKVAHGTEEIRIPAGTGIVGACVAQGESILVNDVTRDQRFFSSIDDSRGYRTHSVACVPLRTEAGVIGALQLLNKQNGFSAEDAELLRFIAMYAASVIQAERLRQEAEAARLLRHELDIAADVQRRLFPQNLPETRGIEYYGFCRPAKFVSGDYYDFLELPGSALAITLGDVAGKGLPAAVLMASIQMLLRNLLSRHGSNLASAVAELNDALHRSSSAERYSTLFCGLFNAPPDRLTYVNAGQVSPLIVRQTDGQIDRPPGGDLPVGLFPSNSYQQHVVQLNPGDLVVCVSDGVLEVMNPQGELWDETVIESLLREHRNDSMEKIKEALIQAIDNYAAGSEQFDDITMVLARIKTG